MLIPTESFVGSVEKWLAAVRSNDLGAARMHAELMDKQGELLVIHPDFRKAFHAHWPELEPKDALQHLTRFLICATEARERAIKETKDGRWKPM